MALQFDTAEKKNVDAKKARQAFRISIPGMSNTPTSNDRMFFTEQLALLLESGESLHGALKVLVDQTESAQMKHVVQRIGQDISEGLSFAGALKKHDAVFSTTYVSLVAASEGGGFMHEVLLQLVDMDKKRDELRNTLVSAATYPAFLMIFSFAVVVFVLVVVFPKFETMFASIYDQLPASTRALMTISHVLREYWIVIVTAGGIGAIAIRQWLVSAAGKHRVDYFKLHAPIVRNVFTQIYLTQSLQVLGLSLNNGVSVMESLESCRDVVENSLYRRLIRNVEEKVQEGAGVAVAFADSEFVPTLAKHMIATGERSGNLGQVMGRIAEYYGVQLTKRLSMLSKLAEPVMLLAMGIVVGVLVSSLILPIFKLSRAVS